MASLLVLLQLYSPQKTGSELRKASFLSSFASLEPCERLGTEMDVPMASTAKGHEIFFPIIS